MDDREAAKMAVMVAIEILDRVNEGEKLLAVHNYYPTGTKAFWLGFRLCAGAIFAIGCAAMMAHIIQMVLP